MYDGNVDVVRLKDIKDKILVADVIKDYGQLLEIIIDYEAFLFTYYNAFELYLYCKIQFKIITNYVSNNF